MYCLFFCSKFGFKVAYFRKGEFFKKILSASFFRTLSFFSKFEFFSAWVFFCKCTKNKPAYMYWRSSYLGPLRPILDHPIWAVFCHKNRKMQVFCIHWICFDFLKSKKFRKNDFFENFRKKIDNFSKNFEIIENFRFRTIEKNSKNAKNLYFPIFIAKQGN